MLPSSLEKNNSEIKKLNIKYSSPSNIMNIKFLGSKSHIFTKGYNEEYKIIK